jgi:hypothetical protein
MTIIVYFLLDKGKFIVTLLQVNEEVRDMSPVIRVTEKTYKRLESHATGFDTPSNVVNRLLDFYETNSRGKTAVKLEPIAKGNKIEPSRTPHKWTKDDDIVAFYLYRFGTDDLNTSLEEIADYLGMNAGSLKMRIQNFQALNGAGGLKNYAKLSERIYSEYGSLSKDEHRAEVKRILG